MDSEWSRVGPRALIGAFARQRERQQFFQDSNLNQIRRQTRAREWKSQRQQANRNRSLSDWSRFNCALQAMIYNGKCLFLALPLGRPNETFSLYSKCIFLCLRSQAGPIARLSQRFALTLPHPRAKYRVMQLRTRKSPTKLIERFSCLCMAAEYR